jgi:isopenicillin N synthase-like dioxygenase
MVLNNLSQIPVIDFSRFISDDITRLQVVEEIYQACSEVGFMYLENFGISHDLIEQVFERSQYFFNLPLEVKQKLAWSDEFSNQGYVGIERERLNLSNPGDLKEAFNISRLHKNIGNINREVSLINDACIVEFFEACTVLANRVLEAFTITLELPTDFFAKNHDQNHHTLRLLHYPPLQNPPKPKQVRAGEHSDYGSITLLFQDKIGGLEIQRASGEWVAAPAIPNTVIVNTGDLMQRWTNHVFCSTKHRVMIPDDAKVEKSRYSIAFFCHPNDNTEITCLPSCMKDKLPMYPPIWAGEYLLQRLQATY